MLVLESYPLRKPACLDIRSLWMPRDTVQLTPRHVQAGVQGKAMLDLKQGFCLVQEHLPLPEKRHCGSTKHPVKSRSELCYRPTSVSHPLVLASHEHGL